MPAYRVEVRATAERDLERLAPPLRERVVALIGSLAADPRQHGVTKLSGASLYRVRVGDHRVIFDVVDRERPLRVIRVRRRREAYRRL